MESAVAKKYIAHSHNGKKQMPEIPSIMQNSIVNNNLINSSLPVTKKLSSLDMEDSNEKLPFSNYNRLSQDECLFELSFLFNTQSKNLDSSEDWCKEGF